MVISSRTPEGSPGSCPVCGASIQVEPSDPAGDAPCPACGHLLWFTRHDDGEAVVIRPTGPLLRPGVVDAIAAQATEGWGSRLVLDFAEVESLSNASLARLIVLRKKVAGMTGQLEIENLRPDLVELFRITRLDQVFRLR